MTKIKSIPMLNQEEMIPEVVIPDNFDETIDEKLRANSLSAEQLYNIVGKFFFNLVWQRIISVIERIAKSFLQTANEFVSQHKSDFESTRIEHQSQSLDETMRTALKIILAPDEMQTAPENLALILGQNNSTAKSPQIKDPEEGMSPEKREFRRWCITRTGSADDPFFAITTSKSIAFGSLSVILPVALIETLAAVLIQSSQKDFLTAFVSGLIFVLVITGMLVFSAYNFALIQGYKIYKKMFLENFPDRTINETTGEKSHFFTLPSWTREAAWATLIFGLFSLLFILLYRLYIVFSGGFSDHFQELSLTVFVFVLNLGVFTYKAWTFPSLPLQELNQYFSLRSRIPNLPSLAENSDWQNEDSDSETNEASDSEPILPSDSLRLDTTDDDREINRRIPPEDVTTVEELQAFYVQEREILNEEIKDEHRQRELLVMNSSDFLAKANQKRDQAKLHLKQQLAISFGKCELPSKITENNSQKQDESKRAELLEVICKLYAPLPAECDRLEEAMKEIKALNITALSEPINFEDEIKKIQKGLKPKLIP